MAWDGVAFWNLHLHQRSVCGPALEILDESYESKPVNLENLDEIHESKPVNLEILDEIYESKPVNLENLDENVEAGFQSFKPICQPPNCLEKYSIQFSIKSRCHHPSIHLSIIIHPLLLSSF